jgi:hypothetical protein
MLLENLNDEAVAPKRERETHNLDPLKPHLTADDWQLYTCAFPPSVMRRVADSLNNATLRTFKAMEKKLGAMKLGTPRATYTSAVYEVMQKNIVKALYRNSKYGAADSEPMSVARGLVVKFAAKCGVEVDPWDL